MGHLKFLTALDLSFLQNVRDLRPLAGSLHLTSLDLVWCQSVKDITPLASCAALTHIDLTFCDGIIDFMPLARLTALVSCTMRELSNLRSLDWIGCFRPSLTSLDLSCANLLTGIRPLAACSALTSLGLRHCSGVTDISALAACRALTSLDLTEAGARAISGILSLEAALAMVGPGLVIKL